MDYTGIDENELHTPLNINSAAITVTSTFDDQTVSTGNVVGILMKNGAGNYSTTFTNSGEISVSAERANVYGIKSNGAQALSLVNSANINVNLKNVYNGVGANYQAYGVNLDVTNHNDISLNNSGIIRATVDGELSDDAFSIYATNADNAAFAGHLDVTNTGELHGSISSGDVYGNANSANPIIRLTNNNLVSLSNNYTSSVDSYTQGASGILRIQLMSDDEGDMDYSKLYVAKSLIIHADSKIDVDVKTLIGNQSLIQGKTLEGVIEVDLEEGNPITAPTTLTVTDNSALLDFKYIKNEYSIDLLISGGQSIFGSVTAGGGNSNAGAAAGALKSIQDGTIPAGMQSFFTALNTLSTDAEVAQAVASTTPQATAASTAVGTQVMNGVQGIVEMRQNNTLGNSGLNSGDIALNNQNLWIKPFGSRGTQDNKNGINGFDVDAYGVGIGYDAEIASAQRVGAAFFYTDAKVNVNGLPQKSDLNVYTALVYGNIPLTSSIDFLYQAGYAWQKTKSERTILLTNNHAEADYTSKSASLDLKLMQNHKINNEFSIRPLIETTYRHSTTPSYSESGAGTSLSVEKFTSTQLILGGGAIVDYRLNKESNLISEFHVGYDFHHEPQSVTASFVGAPSVKFDTEGIDNGGWQYNVGLGYEMLNILAGDINFMYNYQGQGSSFDNHTLSAKYIWKF